MVVRLILVFTIIFISILFLYNSVLSLHKLNGASTQNDRKLGQLFQDIRGRLLKAQNNPLFLSYLKNPNEQQRNDANTVQRIHCTVLLTAKSDLDSYGSKRNVNVFQEALRKADSEITKYGDIKTCFIKGRSGQVYVMMSAGVYDGAQLLGYVSYVLNSADIFTSLSSLEYDIALRNENGTIIAVSNQKLLSEIKKHVANTPYAVNSFTIDGNSYDYKLSSVKGLPFRIMTIIETENTSTFFLAGCCFIVVIGLVLLFVMKKQALKISAINAKSISYLMKEIQYIAQGHPEHKVLVHTRDEFDAVADGINHMIDKLQLLNEKNMELKFQNKVSEIKQLDAQFNPHFLYNTLETIRYGIIIDPAKASDMIIQLTSILRYSISNERNTVQFYEDMEYLKEYLDILSYRFKENFMYELAIEECCYDIIVPKLIIQPLIENAVKYGFQKKKQLHVILRAKIIKRRFILMVEDDGNGMNAEQVHILNTLLLNPQNESDHHGLYNVYRRLQLMYGEESKLWIDSEEGVGTRIYCMMQVKECG